MTVNQASKCVFVIDKALPKGLAANTAAVLATAITIKVKNLVGWDVTDGGGCCHPAITQVAIPVLAASLEELTSLHAAARENADLLVAGFTDVAQRSRTYDEYTARMAGMESASMRFLGVALFGDRKEISDVTQHLKLL